MQLQKLKQLLPGFPDKLLIDLSKKASFMPIPEGQQILAEGQIVKHVPLVIEGLVKVSLNHEDKDLLLYYVKPGESCVMSFYSALKDEKSKIKASTELKSTLMLIPTTLLHGLLIDYPPLNNLFFQQYNKRYQDMLETINQLLFTNLDERLWQYLLEKKENTGKYIFNLTHQELASTMGTAREVISRILRKLEKEGKVVLKRNTIEIVLNK